MAAFVGILGALHGTMLQVAPEMAALAAVGMVFVANGALRLPAWARQRGRQMDEIAERVVEVTQDEQESPPL